MWVVKKGTLVILDQALFASTNFLINVLLARWLALSDYGVFALIYATFLLAGVIHAALFTEPMMVFNYQKLNAGFKEYLNILIIGNGMYAVIICLLALSCYLLFLESIETSINLAILGGIIYAPCTLLLWLARKACHIHNRFNVAVNSGLLYILVTIAGLYGLNETNILTVSSAFLFFAFTGVVSASYIFLSLNIRLRVKNLAIRRVCAEHYSYAKWAIPNGLQKWVSANLFYFVLPIWGGLELSGIFRALMNLLMPVVNINIAITSYLVITLSRSKLKIDFFRKIGYVFIGLISLAVIYDFLLIFYGETIFSFLYGNLYKIEASQLIGLSVLVISLTLLSLTMSILRAMVQLKAVFIAFCSESISIFIFGLFFIKTYFIVGALWVQAISAFIAMLVGIRYSFLYITERFGEAKQQKKSTFLR